MNKSEEQEIQKEIEKNLPKLTREGNKNLFRVIQWQTNDELIETLDRLFLKHEIIDEYMDTINPIVRPISIQGVFDANEKDGRAISTSMLWVAMSLCHAAVLACNMSKRTIRLKDWDSSKFKYVSKAEEDSTALLNIVYHFRIKKGI